MHGLYRWSNRVVLSGGTSDRLRRPQLDGTEARRVCLLRQPIRGAVPVQHHPAMALDWASAAPAHEQIAAVLRERLKQGAYSATGEVPIETSYPPRSASPT